MFILVTRYVSIYKVLVEELNQWWEVLFKYKLKKEALISHLISVVFVWLIILHCSHFWKGSGL